MNELFLTEEWNVYAFNDEHIQLMSVFEEISPSPFEGLLLTGQRVFDENFLLGEEHTFCTYRKCSLPS